MNEQKQNLFDLELEIEEVDSGEVSANGWINTNAPFTTVQMGCNYGSGGGLYHFQP